MNRVTLLAAVIAAPFLCAATVSQGNLYGRYNDGVYLAPGKLFKMSSPFPEEPIVSDGQQPENNHAGAVYFIDQSGIPDAKVLRDEAGMIAGQPAWIAVAHVPNASPFSVVVKNSYDFRRSDSWCGMAVVARGKHYYLLQTELRVEKLAAPDWSYDADAMDWNAFVRSSKRSMGASSS